ncbi:hypothetical protein RAC89_12170 [Paenibacillus sp. GD4]|uniref:hypothetical protein n=1 Tax=Paenibacillus sp. GD4 TaxID=3068890 RepID=UPI0027965D1F|nr:hypothetical protein [Paenibacillus sp. GD4]MDQ1911202.1 hypothetical protein [Paenibacillus sp. GD4]
MYSSRGTCSDEPTVLIPPSLSANKKTTPQGRYVFMYGGEGGMRLLAADCDVFLSKLMLRRTYGSHPSLSANKKTTPQGRYV